MDSMDKQDETFKGIRLDLEERSFYRFSMLARRINRCISGAYVEKFGRPANAWKIITVLGRFGRLSMTAITEHTTLEIDKVTRIVDSLVAQRLAERRQESADRRRVTVSLTARGKKVAGQMEDVIYGMEREFLVALSAPEREALYRILDQLQDKAGQVFSGTRPWQRFL